ncbi:MAG TPA: hypothetical protein GX511_05715 [Firmicutes bacterium]|nr:hypothetical protein [Bacillota bacterium]
MREEDGLKDLGEAALHRALQLLGRRAYTEAELTARLGKEGFPKGAVENAALYAARCGYLDDAEVARREVERCFTEKGWGPYRVRQRLRQRGLAPELIAEVLSLWGEPEVRALCLAVAEKKLRFAASPDQGWRAAQVGRYLLRRGFPPEVVEWCLNRLAPSDGESG